jgi:hypothetical protein
LRALEAQAQPGTAPEPPDDSHVVERERALAERERLLEERVAGVTKRELAIARAASWPAPPPPPEAVPEPEPAPRPAAPQADGGAYNLTALERLVDERGGAHPDRAEEWSSYLYLLRDHASADGSLPASFDALVEETFEPLLT